MNKLIFSALFFFYFSADVFAQQVTNNTIEKELYKSYRRINYWSDFISKHKDAETLSYSRDSLNSANAAFKNMLMSCSQNPNTIKNEYKDLKNLGIDIVTSKDNLFRVYSWNTARSGTWHNFENVAQYIAGGKSFTTTLKCNRAEDPGYYYSDIYTLKANGMSYYLLAFQGIYSDKASGSGIQILTIDNSILNDDVKLIKTASGMHNKLSYDYDFNYYDSHDELLNSIMQYNASTQTISFPVVNAKGQVTKDMIHYKFTGKYFEKTK